MPIDSNEVGPLRVLVVDDDEVDRRWVRRSLGKLIDDDGFAEARCADEALDALRIGAFECVVIDHHLGAETGIDLLQRIRAEGVRTPIVVLTGRGDEQVAVAALKAGASDYLSKSDLTPLQLRRAVRAALRLAATEAAVRQAQDEQGRLIAALAEERERLRRAITQRDEVLAIVSHDLRNPLQSIAIAAEALADEPSDVVAVERYAEVLRQAGDKALELIRNLLDLSRLENGALTLDRRPIEVVDLLQRTIRDHAIAAEGGQVACDAVVEDGVGAVSVDPARFAQVLDNLLANAIRYTPRGGRVTLGARSDVLGVELTVEDTGPGVPPEQLPRLFDRYYQVEGQARPRGSAGLGLPIAKAIVEAHGGSIEAECPDGGGTVFRIRLPR